MSLLALFRKSRVRSPIKREITNLRSAISRTEQRIQEMEDTAWSTWGICCHSCAASAEYGPTYWNLGEKNERRQKRLNELERKLERDAQAQEK
jgi:hypothetical protein